MKKSVITERQEKMTLFDVFFSHAHLLRSRQKPNSNASIFLFVLCSIKTFKQMNRKVFG